MVSWLQPGLESNGVTSLLSMFPSMWLHVARRETTCAKEGQPERREASSLAEQGGKKGAARVYHL